ncbi:MAG: riboflavin synthase [Fastidiosipilaceae bacterium]|jgi:riboflavin synthase
MFTGIIEEQGELQTVRPGQISGELKVRAKMVLEETVVGDSIAVNGVCLTVTSMSSEHFTADVMAESLRRTNLGSLKPGDKVNLERALSLNGRMGGHIVSGHIDGTGEIVKIEREDNAVWFTIVSEDAVMEGLVEKGSIAIDGISLTVVDVLEDRFTVSIIPHTMEETSLGRAKVGMKVNLETDVLGKYVLKYLAKFQDGGGSTRNAKPGVIDEGFLAENGFL